MFRRGKLLVINQYIISFFMLSLSSLMMISKLFDDDKPPFLPWKVILDSPFSERVILVIGLALLLSLIFKKTAFAKLLLCVVAGIFLTYTIAFGVGLKDGFPDIGLITFGALLLIDLGTLWEMN